MAKKLLVSLDPDMVISDSKRHAEFRDALMTRLGEWGYEAACVERKKGTAYDFEVKLEGADILLIAHRSVTRTSVHFNLTAVKAEGSAQVTNLRIIYAKFPHVDYSDFALSLTGSTIEELKILDDRDFFRQLEAVLVSDSCPAERQVSHG
jgi:hypothetical protein